MIKSTNGISSQKAVYQPVDNNSEHQTAKNQKVGRNTDKVEISNQGKKMNKFTSSFMNGAGADGVITGAEMRAFRDEKLREATGHLNDILRNLNIDADSEFFVDYKPEGNRLEVEGNLKDSTKNKLEKTINDNNDFYTAYKAASATAQVIAAGEAHVEFAETYKQNPKAAVAEYSWLFEADWDFKANFSKGQLNLVEEFSYPN